MNKATNTKSPRFPTWVVCTLHAQTQPALLLLLLRLILTVETTSGTQKLSGNNPFLPAFAGATKEFNSSRIPSSSNPTATRLANPRTHTQQNRNTRPSAYACLDATIDRQFPGSTRRQRRLSRLFLLIHQYIHKFLPAHGGLFSSVCSSPSVS